ncbi:hypothetical protein DH2020_006824 [Rehmannia glutinosa]|uniref:Uncharacterized protein n=1 Tax=Rehmannia glutinosa TaxID=99300 RepID=A0ABR0XJZ8_REHGL
MLRILRKTAASMEKSGGSIPAERCDEDLSAWELVNASQSDDEDLYSFDGDDDDVISEGDAVISDGVVDQPESKPLQEEEIDEEARALRVLLSPGDVIAIQSLSVSPPMTLPVEMALSHVFGKQRIKKLGKRGGPKPNKSKRLPYYHNRPGCLYGKHGFGVQHAFI